MMEEEDEVCLPLSRPISRVHCRQRYYFRADAESRNLKLRLLISIVEEGRGSRKGRLREYISISHPVMDGLERQVIHGFLTSSGVREEDANFIITSMSCFGYEILASVCSSGGCLTQKVNVLVGVDHYKNFRRGIKVDQGHRIIKADQYDGVWDSNSIVVDQEEEWAHVVLFDIDDEYNTLRYTFGDSIPTNPDALAFLSPEPTIQFTPIQFTPASQSALRKLKRSLIKKSGGRCTICLEELEVGAVAITLRCRHQFHQGCILDWLNTSHFCPLCRSALRQQIKGF